MQCYVTLVAKNIIRSARYCYIMHVYIDIYVNSWAVQLYIY